MVGNPSNSRCPLPTIVGAMTSLSSSTTSAASSDPSDRNAGVDADIAARPTLQVPHEIDQPAVDHARVGPLAFERRRRCDVLGNGVDEGGERLDLAAWPELSPFVVTAAAEDDRGSGE
jgi:guanyl-specific ribonuclease Sa